MPFDAHPARTDPREDRARRLPAVRLVLLGGLGLGLLGLAVPAAHSSAHGATPSADAHASALPEELAVPYLGQVDAPAAGAALTRDALTRASRSRPAAPRPAAPGPAAGRAVTGPRWVRPVDAPVISGFGQRWGRPHLGDDFAASYGAPIHAIGQGVVVGAGYQPEEAGYGQITLIQHAGDITSAYAHQSRMLVRVGEHVTVGQVIGYVGSTGHVTGPHLHFEIRTSRHSGQIDPRPWLREHDVVV